MTSSGNPGFDVVVVGGGPAGAVMADRLTADPGCSVLLIEAGPDYGGDSATWPVDLLYTEEQPLTSHSWGLHDAGNGMFLPRARVLGGSSTVNACYWIRGSASDYDEWESLGNSGWSFDSLLPYFRKAESDPIGGPLHGDSGPVEVMRAERWSPGDMAFTESAVSLGLAQVGDINGDREQFPSVGPAPRNIVGGHRLNAALSYLAPARRRPNLAIRPDTLVDRVRFVGERVVGVVDSQGVEIDAGMVVLAAGAYFTPGILNRSGLGKAEDLESLGIPVRQHLPGVGENLLDHPFAIGVAAGVLAPKAEPGEQTQGQTMVRGRAGGADAEVDFHVYNGQNLDAESGRWIIGLGVSMVNARSMGTVALSSADPMVLPRVEHMHYSDSSDLERMCDGVELALEMFGSGPLAAIVDPLPTEWKWDDRETLRALLSERSLSTNHCAGTAKMGPASDPLAVVDGSGRVHGAEHLLVADSSVFPTLPRGNIHFPVVAVAEKIAAGLNR
ncbi:MAG: GMC family oxidoreductase N-terminal domain-containing protein [Acidimicrobiia bacterium]